MTDSMGRKSWNAAIAEAAKAIVKLLDEANARVQAAGRERHDGSNNSTRRMARLEGEYFGTKLARDAVSALSRPDDGSGGDMRDATTRALTLGEAIDAIEERGVCGSGPGRANCLELVQALCDAPPASSPSSTKGEVDLMAKVMKAATEVVDAANRAAQLDGLNTYGGSNNDIRRRARLEGEFYGAKSVRDALAKIEGQPPTEPVPVDQGSEVVPPCETECAHDYCNDAKGATVAEPSGAEWKCPRCHETHARIERVGCQEVLCGTVHASPTAGGRP